MSRRRLYSMIWFYVRGLIACTTSCAVVAWLAGCTQEPPTNRPASKPLSNVSTGQRPTAVRPIQDPDKANLANTASVDALLRAMTDTYRQAKTYADAAQIVQTNEQHGKPLPPQTIDFSLTLERPNRIRLHCGDVVVVSDGTNMRAVVQGIEGQVLARSSPEKFSKEDFLDPAFADPELVRALVAVTGPIQLELLLDDDWLNALRNEAVHGELLAPQQIDGQRCQRVKLSSGNGSVVLWIDDKSHLLLRAEFLAAGEPDENGVRLISAVAEFHGARINHSVDPVAFQFEAPPQSVEVKRLVAIDRPVAPPDLFDKAIGDFSFATDDGKLTQQTVVGMPTVLLFWSMNSLPCQDMLLMLQRVSQQPKFARSVAFYAVNTDEMKIPTRDLAAALSRLKVSLPIARNDAEHSQNTFKVQFAPTLIVLGRDGTVQESEVGKNPDLELQLPDTLEKLLAGESTATAARARYEGRLAAYQLAIREAQKTPDSVVRELPRSEVLPASEPTKLALTKLWTATELNAPGNILIVDQPSGPPRIFVHDRWQAVAEVDLRGAVIARHDLDLPPRTPVASFRTAVDHQGRRYFAAFASPQLHAYLYDADWKHIGTVPDPAEGKHDGIADVAFVDPDAAGELNIAIGFWGPDLGVHRFTLDGRRVWRDRNLAPVLGIAQSPRDAAGHAHLFFTSSRGSLLAYNFEGKPAPEADVAVGGLALLRVFTPGGTYASGEFCCLVDDGAGSVGGAVGGKIGTSSRWSYPLPKGVYTEPVEIVAAGPLLQRGESQWALAGADGTVHILASDGTAIDHFATGVSLTGLAITRVADTGLLLTASSAGLQAWRVERK